jgi:hypothetical protein
MHVIDNPNMLLYIEPTGPVSGEPVDDELTLKMRVVFAKAVPTGEVYEEFHRCTSCGEKSTNTDYILPGGMQTNSLCVHYLERHRDEVPKSELAKVEALDVETDDLYYCADERNETRWSNYEFLGPEEDYFGNWDHVQEYPLPPLQPIGKEGEFPLFPPPLHFYDEEYEWPNLNKSLPELNRTELLGDGLIERLIARFDESRRRKPNRDPHRWPLHRFDDLISRSIGDLRPKHIEPERTTDPDETSPDDPTER